MIIILVALCLCVSLCHGPEEKGWYRHLWFEVVSVVCIGCEEYMWDLFSTLFCFGVFSSGGCVYLRLQLASLRLHLAPVDNWDLFAWTESSAVSLTAEIPVCQLAIYWPGSDFVSINNKKVMLFLDEC